MMETNAHIFTNKNGNTLMREFEGVLSNNPSIKNLDAMVGFLRASGYFSLRPYKRSFGIWNEGEHSVSISNYTFTPGSYLVLRRGNEILSWEIFR